MCVSAAQGARGASKVTKLLGTKRCARSLACSWSTKKVGFSLSCAAPRERKRKEIGKKVWRSETTR